MKNLEKISSILLVSTAFLLLTAGISRAQQATGQLFEKALFSEEVKGNLAEAIILYQQVLEDNPNNRQLAAKALLHMGICYEKLGLEKARQTYRDVINKFSEQEKEVSVARERIIRLESYTAELSSRAEQHMKNGNELFKKWEYELAVKEYENAIKLIPNTLLALNARYCIGQSWFRAGKYDTALATFTKLIEENPQSNIAPVTELMVAQVNYAMGNNKNTELLKNYSDESTIIDPKTGIKYIKTKSFSGKNDKIEYSGGGGLNLSPDGRFLICEDMVFPADGSDAFKLVDMKATRSIYSPDMKKAAFYADSAIWVVPVSPETGRSTGSPVKLLDGKYRFQYNVSWSPDGEKLVFNRFDKEFAGDIWTISVSDGSLTAVTDEEGAYRCPVWSPDGKTIAYWNNMEVWLAPAEGGKSKKIINFGGVPFWSHDGKWLYHSWGRSRKLFCLADSQDFDLIIPGEVGHFFAFSPDSKKMLFYHPSYDATTGFKVVSSSGGPSFEPGRDLHFDYARWSPDSKTILAAVATDENEDGDFFYRILSLGGGESYTKGIDVTVNVKPVPFDISTDHKKLAFTIAREDGSKDLYVVPISVKDSRTTGPPDLVFNGWFMVAYNVDFSWSADGNNLALIHKNNIWIVPLSGGKPTQITNTPEQKSWINFSPDGKMVSYFVESKMKTALHMIPLSGGNSTKVLDDCETASWSPDSKVFAVYSGGNISIIGLNGQIIRHIINQKDLNLDDWNAPKWSPDGKYLAFFGYKTQTEGKKAGLFMISAAGGNVIELAPEGDAYKSDISWSPDGKWIGFYTEETVKVRPEGSMWEADFEEIIKKLLPQK